MAEHLVDDRERFRERYQVSGSDPLIAAELEVLGSDYQANGYTTMAQADDLGVLLRLDATSRLLDVGSGCGWPGLYLAKKYRCAVVSVDPVDEGIRAALERAGRDRISSHGAALATGSDLPFRSAVFDAVVHTDVTC